MGLREEWGTTLAAKLESWRILCAATGTAVHEWTSTFATEFLPFGIFAVTDRAVHTTSFTPVEILPQGSTSVAAGPDEASL